MSLELVTIDRLRAQSYHIALEATGCIGDQLITCWTVTLCSEQVALSWLADRPDALFLSIEEAGAVGKAVAESRLTNKESYLCAILYKIGGRP